MSVARAEERLARLLLVELLLAVRDDADRDDDAKEPAAPAREPVAA